MTLVVLVSLFELRPRFPPCLHSADARIGIPALRPSGENCNERDPSGQLMCRRDVIDDGFHE
jgi:hypothetical protein